MARYGCRTSTAGDRQLGDRQLGDRQLTDRR
jgi:hypothetical protein